MQGKIYFCSVILVSLGKRGKRSNIFEEIALHTSSSVIQTSHSTLGDILGHVLQVKEDCREVPV